MIILSLDGPKVRLRVQPSDITELLRNGASLPEARELARHSDIRMTMKYTHIGIEDQARAASRLPLDIEPTEKAGDGDNAEPGRPQETEPGDDIGHEKWQRSGNGTCNMKGHSVSSTDNETAPQAAGSAKKTLAKTEVMTLSSTQCHRLTIELQKWRPPPRITTGQELRTRKVATNCINSQF